MKDVVKVKKKISADETWRMWMRKTQRCLGGGLMDVPSLSFVIHLSEASPWIQNDFALSVSIDGGFDH